MSDRVNDQTREIAERLATDGFRALVPDLAIIEGTQQQDLSDRLFAWRARSRYSPRAWRRKSTRLWLGTDALLEYIDTRSQHAAAFTTGRHRTAKPTPVDFADTVRNLLARAQL